MDERRSVQDSVGQWMKTGSILYEEKFHNDRMKMLNTSRLEYWWIMWEGQGTPETLRREGCMLSICPPRMRSLCKKYTLVPELGSVTFSSIINIENWKPDSHTGGLVAVEATLWVREGEEVIQRRALHILTKNNWPRGPEDISHY